MAGLACEAVDLVFDGRAIARPHALNHTGIHRRPVQGAADDLMGRLIGMSDPEWQLAGMHVATTHEKNTGCGVSPGCSASNEKSMLRASRRGGVPVFKRPTGRLISRNLAASVMEAGSPARPA